MHESIVGAIREQILTGELRPGERLPPRTAIERRFETTPATVQRAFARLISDGFVDAVPRQGTFVADPPPHLREYSVLIYSKRTPPYWGNKFWSTLDRVAADISRTTSRRVKLRPGINPEGREDELYQELLYDIRSKRLAGVAFLFPPEKARGTPLMAADDLPKVSLVASSVPGVPQILLDGAEYWEKALDHIRQSGRRRVAVVTPSGVPDSVWERVQAGAEARGLICHTRWIQAVDLAYPQWADNATQLLLSGSARERPDALVIADDNLIDYACRGMLAAGARPEEDLSVIAHANFPVDGVGPLPLCRLGYDVRGLLETAMDTLDQVRRGAQFPEPIRAPAVFESELSAAMSDSIMSGLDVEEKEAQYVL